MRAWVVLLLLVPAAAAQGGQHVGRDGWVEFVPEWRAGPAVIGWQGRDVNVGEGVSYATDGAGWLYGSNESIGVLTREHDCVSPWPNATAVVVHAATCTMALHPTVECVGTDVCAVARESRVEPTTSTAATPTPSRGLQTTFAPTPDCGRVPGAYCTPAPPMWLVIVMLGIVALSARASRRA